MPRHSETLAVALLIPGLSLPPHLPRASFPLRPRDHLLQAVPKDLLHPSQDALHSHSCWEMLLGGCVYLFSSTFHQGTFWLSTVVKSLTLVGIPRAARTEQNIAETGLHLTNVRLGWRTQGGRKILQYQSANSRKPLLSILKVCRFRQLHSLSSETDSGMQKNSYLECCC